jgi:hypothetical protein
MTHVHDRELQMGRKMCLTERERGEKLRDREEEGQGEEVKEKRRASQSDRAELVRIWVCSVDSVSSMRLAET